MLKVKKNNKQKDSLHGRPQILKEIIESHKLKTLVWNCCGSLPLALAGVSISPTLVVIISGKVFAVEILIVKDRESGTSRIPKSDKKPPNSEGEQALKSSPNVWRTFLLQGITHLMMRYV